MNSSRATDVKTNGKSSEKLNELYRADIVDINHDYIGKTISSNRYWYKPQ